MADWALSQCERQEFSAAQVARTAGANTKSAYVQVTAATGFAYSAVSLILNSSGGGGQCYLVDIAIGAGGSEQVIIPNILFDSMRQAGNAGMCFTLPVSIPAGTRVAARLQETSGSGTRTVELCVIGRAGGSNANISTSGSATNYGANTSTSNGILVDQGGVANTYGAWTQITAGTTSNHSQIIANLGQNQTTNTLGGYYDFQIGIGAGGLEVVIAEFQTLASANISRMLVATYDINAAIPAGTRLAMRAKCDMVSANDRTATAVIIGV